MLFNVTDRHFLHDSTADESLVSACLELSKEIAVLKDLGRKAHPNVMSMLGVCFNGMLQLKCHDSNTACMCCNVSVIHAVSTISTSV